MLRFWFSLGALCAGLGVAAGAFGAHGLRSRVTPDLLNTWETASRYQLYHALALLLIGAMGDRLPPRVSERAGILFLCGILLFSGSLYAMTLSGQRMLGAITPLGGVAFLGGWFILAVGALPHQEGAP